MGGIKLILMQRCCVNGPLTSFFPLAQHLTELSQCCARRSWKSRVMLNVRRLGDLQRKLQMIKYVTQSWARGRHSLCNYFLLPIGQKCLDACLWFFFCADANGGMKYFEIARQPQAVPCITSQHITTRHFVSLILVELQISLGIHRLLIYRCAHRSLHTLFHTNLLQMHRLRWN